MRELIEIIIVVAVVIICIFFSIGVSTLIVGQETIRCEIQNNDGLTITTVINLFSVFFISFIFAIRQVLYFVDAIFDDDQY